MTEWLPLTADVAPGFYWAKPPTACDAILLNIYEACDGKAKFVIAVAGDDPRGESLSVWLIANPGILLAPAVAPPLPANPLCVIGMGRTLYIRDSNVQFSMVTNSKMTDTAIYDCDARGVTIGKADLTGLRITHCNLTKMVIDKCDLTGATVNGVPILRKPPLISVSPSGDYLTVHGAVPGLDVDLVPREISGVSLTAGEAADLLRQAIA